MLQLNRFWLFYFYIVAVSGMKESLWLVSLYLEHFTEIP